MSDSELFWGVPRLESTCGASLRTGSIVVALCLLVAAASGLVIVIVPDILSKEQKLFVGALSVLQLVAGICLLYGSVRMAKGCVGAGQVLLGIFIVQEIVSVILIVVVVVLLLFTDWKLGARLGSLLSTYSWPQPLHLSEDLQYHGYHHDPGPGYWLMFIVARCVFLGVSMYFFLIIWSFFTGDSFYHVHTYYY